MWATMTVSLCKNCWRKLLKHNKSINQPGRGSKSSLSMKQTIWHATRRQLCVVQWKNIARIYDSYYLRTVHRTSLRLSGHELFWSVLPRRQKRRFALCSNLRRQRRIGRRLMRWTWGLQRRVEGIWDGLCLCLRPFMRRSKSWVWTESIWSRNANASNGDSEKISDKTPIPPPDWEALISVVADEILAERSPARILQVRERLYDLLTHCIPPTTVLKVSSRISLTYHQLHKLTYLDFDI